MSVNQEHILKIMSKKNTREFVFLLIGFSLFAGGGLSGFGLGGGTPRQEDTVPEDKRQARYHLPFVWLFEGRPQLNVVFRTTHGM